MELPGKPLNATYQNEERDQIRRDLIEYCTQHCIGSPTLQSRIAAANDRTIDEVNNKTLQRFLAGQHRTNDAFVWLCHKFLLGVDVADPVKQFGDAATAFFQCSADIDAIASVSGQYDITAYGDGDEDTEQSSLDLVPVADRPYLRATEEVGGRAGGNTHEAMFEGVAFLRPKGFSIVLRDTLTRRQKWHMLYPGPPSKPDEFAGQMMTPLFFGSSEGANAISRVRMSKKGIAAHGS